MVLTNRSAWGFKFADRGGSLTDRTPLVVVQTQSLVSEFLPKDAILFAKKIKRVALLLIEPAGDRNR